MAGNNETIALGAADNSINIGPITFYVLCELHGPGVWLAELREKLCGFKTT